MIDKSKVKKILMISLSNIGDIILTLPVLGVLNREFPDATITAMAGPRGEEVFGADTRVENVVLYNKRVSFFDKLKLGLSLRRDRFDMVVDLRNTFFPLLIWPRYRTPFFIRFKKQLHSKDKHLKRLSAMGISVEKGSFAISLNREDKLGVQRLLNESGLLLDDKMIAVAPGAKSHIKRWEIDGFKKLCAMLTRELNVKVLLIGDESDAFITKDIAESAPVDVYDLSGRTTLRELAYLLSLCKMLVTNDSAPLHIASAVKLPVVAIFGPTDEKRYGPVYAESSVVIRKNLKCAPCETALCKYDLECMKEISVDEVFAAVRKLMNNKQKKPETCCLE
ncbi:glycosyltransferase family 9 protein [Candidatus Omnitrophota bacterium]